MKAQMAVRDIEPVPLPPKWRELERRIARLCDLIDGADDPDVRRKGEAKRWQLLQELEAVKAAHTGGPPICRECCGPERTEQALRNLEERRRLRHCPTHTDLVLIRIYALLSNWSPALPA